MLAGRGRGREALPDRPEAGVQPVEGVLQGRRSAQSNRVAGGEQPAHGPWPRVLQPRPDALEAVVLRLERVGCRVQGGAEVSLVVG